MSSQRHLIVLSMIFLGACAAPYTLVPAGVARVADRAIVVQPTSTWNRIPKTSDDVQWEESWTKNGPLLDTMAFIGGLPDGKALVRQKKKDDRQVPPFRASMSPEDLVSMIETNYRARGVAVFEVEVVEPAHFLQSTGIRLDYAFVHADKLPRKGRCVMTIIGDKLYLMMLEGAASHYFDSVLPEFQQIAASAALP